MVGLCIWNRKLTPVRTRRSYLFSFRPWSKCYQFFQSENEDFELYTLRSALGPGQFLEALPESQFLEALSESQFLEALPESQFLKGLPEPQFREELEKLRRESRELEAMMKDARGPGQYVRAVSETERTNFLELLKKMTAANREMLARITNDHKGLGQYLRVVPESEGSNKIEHLEKIRAGYRDPDDLRPVMIRKTHSDKDGMLVSIKKQNYECLHLLMIPNKDNLLVCKRTVFQVFFVITVKTTGGGGMLLTATCLVNYSIFIHCRVTHLCRRQKVRRAEVICTRSRCMSLSPLLASSSSRSSALCAWLTSNMIPFGSTRKKARSWRHYSLAKWATPVAWRPCRQYRTRWLSPTLTRKIYTSLQCLTPEAVLCCKSTKSGSCSLGRQMSPPSRTTNWPF